MDSAVPGRRHSASEFLKKRLIRRTQLEQACIWYDDPDPPEPPICSLRWINKKRAWFGGYIHWWPVQLFITFLILVDLVLSVMDIMSELSDEQEEEDKNIQLISRTVLFALAVEVILRMFIDGRAFLNSTLNVVEAFIIIGGVVLIFVGANVPVGVARIVKPITRGLRGGRVALKVWLRGGHLKKSASQAIARQVKLIISTFMTDLIRVRHENVHVHPLLGTFHLRKARLCAEAVSDTHSPFALLGGFVDDLHVKAPIHKMKRVRCHWFCNCCRRGQSSQSMEDDSSALLEVEIHNALLVIGPGPEVDWHDEESIMKRKAKLTAFIVDHTIPKNLPDVQAVAINPENGEAQKEDDPGLSVIITRIKNTMNGVTRVVIRAVLDIFRRRVIQGAKITVSNIVIQYEDCRGSPHQRYVMGYKLGSLSFMTFMHASGLKQLMKEADASEIPSNASTPARGDSGLRISGTPRQSGPSWEPEACISENVAIQLERVSTYCSVRPSSTVCYGDLLSTFQMQAALCRLKILDLREKLRLALAKRRSKHQPPRRTPCSGRGEPLPDWLQQHAYVLLPLAISVNWSIPGLIGSLDEDEEHRARAFRITNSPMSVLVDNRQMASLNSLIDDVSVWCKSDRQLHLRPETRIEEVLHRPMHGKDEHWHATATRRAVVRQWWQHARVLALDSAGTRTRSTSCLHEVQVRASRRLEYIEFVTHHRFRTRKYSGRCWSLVECCHQLLYPHETEEDESVIHRQNQLQIRMPMTDIIRSTLEARYAAARREAEHIARSRSRILRRKLTTSSSRSFLFDKDDESDEEDDTMTNIRTSRSFGAFVKVNTPSLGRSRKNKKKEKKSVRAELAELGLHLEQFVPEFIAFKAPVAEVSFYEVSEWEAPRSRGGIRPPRYHPSGTRQKLLHAWFLGGGLTVTLGSLIWDDEWPTLEGAEAVRLVCGEVGAKYADARTGVEREAMWFVPVQAAEESTQFFFVANLLRDHEYDSKRLSRLVTEQCVTPQKHVRNLPWSGVLHIGQLSVSVDTLHLRRVRLLLGDIVPLVHQKLMRWILAEPYWTEIRPVLKCSTDSSNQPVLGPEAAKENYLRRYYHLVTRFTEILTGMKLPFRVEINLEVNFGGAHCVILQPEWTEGQWSDWEKKQVPHGGYPGRRPPDPAAHMIECEVNVPQLRPRIHRSTRPVQVSVQLLPLVTDILHEKADGNDDENAADQVAADVRRSKSDNSVRMSEVYSLRAHKGLVLDESAIQAQPTLIDDADAEYQFVLGEMKAKTQVLVPPLKPTNGHDQYLHRL